MSKKAVTLHNWEFIIFCIFIYYFFKDNTHNMIFWGLLCIILFKKGTD